MVSHFLGTSFKFLEISNGFNFMSGAEFTVCLLSSESRIKYKYKTKSSDLGDVIRIATMGQPVIILSSYQAAFDLLESRGNVEMS